MEENVKAFLEDIKEVCIKHKKIISTSMYDSLQIWDADENISDIYDCLDANGIEDKTQ